MNTGTVYTEIVLIMSVGLVGQAMAKRKAPPKLSPVKMLLKTLKPSRDRHTTRKEFAELKKSAAS
jgi:hypothetical protein